MALAKFVAFFLVVVSLTSAFSFKKPLTSNEYKALLQNHIEKRIYERQFFDNDFDNDERQFFDNELTKKGLRTKRWTSVLRENKHSKRYNGFEALWKMEYADRLSEFNRIRGDARLRKRFLSNAFKKVKSWVKSGVKYVSKGIIKVSKWFGKLGKIAVSGWKHFKKAVSSVGKWIKDTATKVWNVAKDFARKALTYLINKIKKAVSKKVECYVKKMQPLLKLVKKGICNLKRILKNLKTSGKSRAMEELRECLDKPDVMKAIQQTGVASEGPAKNLPTEKLSKTTANKVGKKGGKSGFIKPGRKPTRKPTRRARRKPTRRPRRRPKKKPSSSLLTARRNCEIRCRQGPRGRIARYRVRCLNACKRIRKRSLQKRDYRVCGIWFPKTLFFQLTAGASYGLGVDGAFGVAIGFKGKTPEVRLYMDGALSLGVQAGASGGVQVGLTSFSPSEMGGWNVGAGVNFKYFGGFDIGLAWAVGSFFPPKVTFGEITLGVGGGAEMGGAVHIGYTKVFQ